MEIRKTTMDDLDMALSLYAKARQFMEEHGNPSQWNNSYPPKELVQEDIRRGCSYLCVEGGQTLAIFYFANEEEPDYAKIYASGRFTRNPKRSCHFLHQLVCEEKRR